MYACASRRRSSGSSRGICSSRCLRVALHGVVCIWRLSCAAAIITLPSWGQLRVQGSWPLLLPDPINTTLLSQPTQPPPSPVDCAYRGGVLATVALFVWGRQNAEVAGCEGSCCDTDQLHMDVGCGAWQLEWRFDMPRSLLQCAHRAESTRYYMAGLLCFLWALCARAPVFVWRAGCVAGAAVLLLMLLLLGAAALRRAACNE